MTATPDPRAPVTQFTKRIRWAYVCERCDHHAVEMVLDAGLVPDSTPPLCPRCQPYAQTRLAMLGSADDPKHVGPDPRAEGAIETVLASLEEGLTNGDLAAAKAELAVLRDAELVARALMKLDAVGFWFHARLDYWSDEQQAAIRATGLPALTDAARDALRKAIA